nr:MAG TPA: hypothetical protein [Caudoviricetes sp.]
MDATRMPRNKKTAYLCGFFKLRATSGKRL